jgi:hypothetical protein
MKNRFKKALLTKSPQQKVKPSKKLTRQTKKPHLERRGFDPCAEVF